MSDARWRARASRRDQGRRQPRDPSAIDLTDRLAELDHGPAHVLVMDTLDEGPWRGRGIDMRLWRVCPMVDVDAERWPHVVVRRPYLQLGGRRDDHVFVGMASAPVQGLNVSDAGSRL